MSDLKKLLFAALTTGLALLLVEGLLWLASLALDRDWRVDPLPVHEDYQVLCDFGDLVKLCPDRGPDYERVRPLVFARDKDLPRVVAIGESFVYGLGLPAQDAWPARLQAALGGSAEVLNLGRCGTYASRLVPLVSAAIELDADVVVLAAGNNEHTMTSFYSGWAGRHPLTVYRVGQVLGRLQLFGLMSGAIGIPTRVEESFEERPAQLGAEVDQQVYAARRRPPDLSAFARADLPEGVALASPQVTRIIEEEQRLKERIFEGHMAAMVQSLQDAGVAVVLATLPRDITVPPVLSGVHSDDEAAVVEMIDRLERGGPATEDLVTQALAIDPGVSFFHYKQGLRLRDQGRVELAAAALRQAVEWDLVPDATPSINRITEELGAEYGVPVVDLDHLADGWLRDPDGFFLDKVHVSTDGAEAVAQAIAPAVKDAVQDTLQQR